MCGHISHRGLSHAGLETRNQNEHYSTVWSAAVLVTLPTDICHVQSLKISLKKQHSIKSTNKKPKVKRCNFFIMIHLRAKATCQAKQVIESFAVRAEQRVARSKLRGERWQQDTAGSAVQSSRQDLKRKVWLFEWFD